MKKSILFCTIILSIVLFAACKHEPPVDATISVSNGLVYVEFISPQTLVPVEDYVDEDYWVQSPVNPVTDYILGEDGLPVLKGNEKRLYFAKDAYVTIGLAFENDPADRPVLLDSSFRLYSMGSTTRFVVGREYDATASKYDGNIDIRMYLARYYDMYDEKDITCRLYYNGGKNNIVTKLEFTDLSNVRATYEYVQEDFDNDGDIDTVEHLTFNGIGDGSFFLYTAPVAPGDYGTFRPVYNGKVYKNPIGYNYLYGSEEGKLFSLTTQLNHEYVGYIPTFSVQQIYACFTDNTAGELLVGSYSPLKAEEHYSAEGYVGYKTVTNPKVDLNEGVDAFVIHLDQVKLNSDKPDVQKNKHNMVTTYAITGFKEAKEKDVAVTATYSVFDSDSYTWPVKKAAINIDPTKMDKDVGVDDIIVMYKQLADYLAAIPKCNLVEIKLVSKIGTDVIDTQYIYLYIQPSE